MGNKPENRNIEQSSLSFKKKERLCSKKIIDKLFSEGESFPVFPLKFVFLKTTLPFDSPVQTGFSVGKKTFKKAVQRNLIKRRMREAYRLNKHILYQNTGTEGLALFILFIGKAIPEYKLIEDAMKKALKLLVNKIGSDRYH